MKKFMKKYEKVVSTENKEQHWNLKRAEIIRDIRGASPPKYLAFYAKVFLKISTIYSTAFVIHWSFLKHWDKIQALV